MKSPTRTKKARTHHPCPKCGSSDALVHYETGPYCFSCGHKFFLDKKEEEEIEQIKTPDTYRGISSKTLDFFGVVFTKDSSYWPYGETWNERSHEGKRFSYHKEEGQEFKPFGIEKFGNGSAKAITICETAIDAASVYDMMGGFPVIGCRSASSAKNEIAPHQKYCNSFDKIYLCFDNDDPGREACSKVAALFDSKKVFIVELSKHKDANDYLTNGDVKEFRNAWWSAKKHLPKGILSGQDVPAILAKEDAKAIASYPFSKMEEMTFGIRSKELVLVTAQEKIGKTEFFRAIEHHLLKTTNYNLGIIHLEEGVKRAIQGFVSYELGKPVHLPTANVPTDAQIETYKQLDPEGVRISYYPHFGTDDPDIILQVIRYMVTGLDCKFIFLDHLTMLVTGVEGDDERRTLDYLATQLSMLTRELDFTLFLISHVNDEGQTRGSRLIGKQCDLRINISRDKVNPNEIVRNTTKTVISDNRFSGQTGQCDDLYFDRETGKLGEAKSAAPF